MCTGIRIRAKNGNPFYGRTLEFGQPTTSNIILIPKGYPFTGTAPSGAPGLVWKTQYALVGANMLDMIGVVDGINEKGLAGGLFYFPDYARYQDIMQDTTHTIAPWELMTWILSTCASVDEVVAKIADIVVAEVIFEPWGFVPPLHAIVHDVHGRSIVIEYSNKKCTIYDNPEGVITNAPTFEWHQTNLKNYSTISPYNSSAPALGQGSGMLGLPGDFTPPSRFVRASFFTRYMIETDTDTDARDAVFHILNLFDIPKGIIRDREKDSVYYDHTQWTSVSDLKNRHYYWRTYENNHMYHVRLMDMLGDADKPLIIPMHYPEKSDDVTP